MTMLLLLTPAHAQTKCDGWADPGSTHRNAGNGCTYRCGGSGAWEGPLQCDGQGNGLFQGDPPADEAERQRQLEIVRKRQNEAAARTAEQELKRPGSTAAQAEITAAQREREAVRQQALLEAQRQAQVQLAKARGENQTTIDFINREYELRSIQVAEAQGVEFGRELFGSNADVSRLAAEGYDTDAPESQGVLSDDLQEILHSGVTSFVRVCAVNESRCVRVPSNLTGAEIQKLCSTHERFSLIQQRSNNCTQLRIQDKATQFDGIIDSFSLTEPIADTVQHRIDERNQTLFCQQHENTCQQATPEEVAIRIRAARDIRQISTLQDKYTQTQSCTTAACAVVQKQIIEQLFALQQSDDELVSNIALNALDTINVSVNRAELESDIRQNPTMQAAIEFLNEQAGTP